MRTGHRLLGWGSELPSAPALLRGTLDQLLGCSLPLLSSLQREQLLYPALQGALKGAAALQEQIALQMAVRRIWLRLSTAWAGGNFTGHDAAPPAKDTLCDSLPCIGLPPAVP